MKYKQIFLLIVLLFGMTASLNLQPDSNNALQMSIPTNSVLGQNLFFRFSFPSATLNMNGPAASGSNGLTTKQFIGVQFPFSLGTELSLNTGSIGCALTDGTNNIAVTAVTGTASPINTALVAETNVAYCRIDENSALVPLKTGPSVVYKLTLTLSGKKFTSNFVRAVSLFTSTSNNPEKMIIDSIPVIGTLGVYGDYTAISPKPLDVTSPTVVVTAGPSAAASGSTVFPFNTFDVTLTIKANSFITAADNWIVFRYPTTAVTAPTSVTTADILTTDPLQVAAKGTLALKAFGTDSVYLDGLGEDLVPNRTFKLTLKGWKSLDSNVAAAQSLETFVYYKNTYSIFSYVKSSVFTIIKATVTLTANHPEHWDVYQSGAWPIAFTFTSNSDLTNGGYVVIQHSNSLLTSDNGGNVVTFIASTCDFSGNDASAFDNSFGKRPNCYPLRNDSNYPGADKTTAVFAGSGIFFRMNGAITGGKTYKLTVWAFFDSCSGTSKDALNVVNKTASAYVQPKFSVNVYRTIDVTKTNENRFDTNQMIIGGSTTEATFGGKCWNNYMYDGHKDSQVGQPFGSAVIADYVNLEAAGTDNTKTSILYYKEIHDWNTYSVTSDQTPGNGVAGGFFQNADAKLNMIGGNPTGTGKYFYSSNNAIGSGSYFLAYFKLPGLATGKKIFQLMATPLIAGTKAPPGKIVYQFSSAWFQEGNGYKTGGSCFASWSIGSLTFDHKLDKVYGTDVALVKLFPPFATGTKKLDYGTTDQIKGQKNFFGAQTNIGTQASTIDTGNSLLYPDFTGPAPGKILQLVSTVTGGEDLATNSPFIFWANADTMNSSITNRAYIQGGFFTSCVKWISTPPTITSIFTYIDVQIKFNYLPQATAYDSTSMGTTISNVRLIKLFPESGVFHDFDKNPTLGTPSAAAANPFTNHMAYTADGTEAVCVIELSGAALSTAKDNNSNTLVLWLFGGILLETDYNDLTAQYPAAPLLTGITAYGLSSQTIDNQNDIDQCQGKSTTNNVTTCVFVPITYEFSTLNSSKSLSTDKPDQFRNNATSYKFFMGSVMLFTGVSTANITGTTETYLLIPYYCPKYNSQIGGAADFTGTNMLPTIIGAWMNMSAYNSIGGLGRYITYKDTVSWSAPEPYYTLLGSRIDVATTGILNVVKDKITAGSTISQVTLKFNSYSETAADAQKLYVYNGTNLNNGTAGTAAYCTGSALFLSSIMNFSTTASPTWATSFTSSVGKADTKTTFYVMGKAFNKAVLTGYGATTTLLAAANIAALSPTTTENTASANFYTGIVRPTVDQLVSNNNLVLTDRVAFFCTSAHKAQNTVLSNYVASANAPLISNFLLDWQKKATVSADWATPAVALDKTDVGKSDPAGNMKITINPPTALPAGAILRFTAKSSAFTANTICGLVLTTPSVFANPCNNEASKISCTVPGGTSFTVCCYNVLITDPLALDSLVVSFPTDPAIPALATQLTTDLFNASALIASTPNPFAYATNNSALTDFATKQATITAVTYSQVNQEQGIGKVMFTVTLPREVVRNMKLSITGDLAAMVVTGNLPRCHASFANGAYGASWDNGDALIDSCSTSNLASGTPIVVTTKSLIYKCGQAFSKVLYISLWPIQVINFTSAANKTFKVALALNSGEAIINNTSTFTIALSGSVAAKVAVSGQWDSLCAVSSVTPRIPGEVADYQFDFDLDTNKTGLANTNPNEVTIFFPYNFYGSFVPNVMCSSGGALVNCSFTDEGILNVRFSTNLTVGSGKKISVIVMGVVNPAIDADYSFPCTVNNTNFSNGVRTNLITGSGKLTGGITTTGFTALGNLRFLSVAVPVTDRNPRNVSVHKFRVTFDSAVGLTSTSAAITIANTPVIYVTFPANYRLALFASKPSATIDEYTSDDKNVITKSTSITNATVTVSGNRVALTLSTASYTFGTNWRYWDITITNINNPSDNTSQTTSRYNVIITNSNATALYRTYTNINTMSTDLLTPAADTWLTNNRGYAFNFDNNKYVVDIYSNNSSLNTLLIKPGRFLQSYYVVRSNSNTALAPWVTTMSVSDKMYVTDLASYTLSTSLMQPLGFMIGVPCGTIPGSYILNFSSSDSTNFAPLSPVMVTIDGSTVGTIAIPAVPNVPISGSVFVGFTLSEPNVDALTIAWTGVDANDASAKITNANIPVGTVNVTGQPSPVVSVFTVTSSSATLPPQVFKTVDPNACYSFGGSNTLTLTISGAVAIFTPTLITNINNNFKYTNSATDTTLATSRNSIRFNFTPPVAPIYVFCALACINQDYPANADIIAPKLKPSNLLQFYSNLVSTTTAVDIIFNNLVRGQAYHLKCVIQTTHGDASARSTINATFENWGNSTANATATPIAPQAATATQCAQFQFLADPGATARSSIINYCQRTFSQPGWLNNGCVICTNSDMNTFVAGVGFTQNTTCSAPAKTRLRFLQTANSTVAPVPANTTTTVTYTVCPVPNPVCLTDATAGGKTYNDYFNSFTNGLKTAALFKTNLGLDGISLNTTTPIVSFNDAVAPDINKLVAVVSNADPKGTVNIQLTATSPQKCYWQIAEASVAMPTYASISTCTDASWCGNTKVSVSGVTVSPTVMRAFAPGSSYNVFVGCSNDIPMAQAVSAVKNINTFTIAAPQPSTPTNTTTNSTVVPISGNTINVSMFVLFLIFSLLFN